MLRESMTPLERWQAVLERRAPDRVPMDWWGTDEAAANLISHLGCATLTDALQQLGVDFVVKVQPRFVGPDGSGCRPPTGASAGADDPRARHDPFGRLYRTVTHSGGSYEECVNAPLAGFSSVAEIEASYRWPEPDWWEYGELVDQVAGLETHPVQGGGSEPFLIYKDLRGQEQAFIDLIEHPDLVRYCLEKLFDLAYEDTVRVFETLGDRVLLCYIAEDMGGQDNLLFSLAHIREFFLPGMRRMIDLAHSAGVYVFHHSDGAIRPVIPEMIAAGIDILNPIQWRCSGMDRAGLKADFGDRVIFHGAMDNQHTLPFCTPVEVEREVAENLALLGTRGGYIPAPCHNLQGNTPPENVVTMYEAIRRISLEQEA